MQQFLGDQVTCAAAQSGHQRCRCKACTSRFDDLTSTALAGHHQPLRVWVLCLCFTGLNFSNRQVAGEPGLAISDVQAMTEQLRHGLVAEMPVAELEGALRSPGSLGLRAQDSLPWARAGEPCRVLRCDGGQRRAAGVVQRTCCARDDTAQRGFHLGPGRLDEVQVRRIGGQEALGEA